MAHTSHGAGTHRKLIAVAVVEHQGKYLIGRRPGDAPLGGLWEFPGGKVRREELPEQAAVRECAEETGLNVEVCGELPTVFHDYPHGRLELRFFACRLVGTAETPRTPFRWVPAGDLLRYAFPPANAALIQQLVSPSRTMDSQ